MDLPAFVGKLFEEQDGDVLREGIRILTQALMETGVAGLIGAERHERTGERTAYRNGSRTGTRDTRMGTIELAIPKVKSGTYFPTLLQPRRRAEHALLAVVQEAYVHGVSTRKVDDLMKATGMRLVISDAHEGKQAISTVFTDTAWQRCRVHYADLRIMPIWLRDTRSTAVLAATMSA